MSDAHRLEGEIGELLFEVAADQLSGQGLAGLKWSPRMPEDDPNADYLVLDAEGNEFVLEIDVNLFRSAA